MISGLKHLLFYDYASCWFVSAQNPIRQITLHYVINAQCYSKLFSPCCLLNRLASFLLLHWLPKRSASKIATEGRGIWLQLMLRTFLGLSVLQIQLLLSKKLIFLGSQQLKCVQLTSWITVWDLLYMQKFPQQHILVRSSHIYTGGQWSGS